MIWFALLKRFWTLIPLTAGLIAIVYMGHRLDVLTEQRDKAQAQALQYQNSAREWEASFRQSETLRKNEQEGSVQAINASELSCEARVAKARSSAVKIERIVSREPVCKPGEALERKLVDPGLLRDAVGGVR